MVDFQIARDHFYDSATVRRRLGITDSALKKARDSGELEFTRKGNQVLYRGQWLLDWLQPAEATA